jgi:alpha-1,6-mannosyltransferase
MNPESVPHSSPVDRPAVSASSARRALGYVVSIPGALLSLGLASAFLYYWGGDLHRFTQWVAAYAALYVAQFAIYLAAAYAVLRVPTRLSPTASTVSVVIVLVFAGGFRAQLVDKRPYLSTDVYRYIWDGRVQSAGINPYRYVPSAPELASLRDDKIYPAINRGDYVITPYPPVAQAIYWMVYSLRPSSVIAFKTAMSLFDMVTMIAILLVLVRMGLEPARLVLFAWNPLLIFEGAHSGHIESAFIALLSLALLSWSHRKPSLTGAALGLATMVKFYPALLLPAFLIAMPGLADDKSWRPPSLGLLKGLLNACNIRLIVAFGATIVVAYLPYLSVGTGVFGPLGNEFREEGFVGGGGRYFLLALLRTVVPLPTTVFAILAALALCGVGLWALLRNKKDAVEVATTALSLIGVYSLITSPRYPWYYAWLIPYLCFVPRLGWIYLTGATVLLYFLWYTPLQYPEIPLWLGAALYLPTVAMLVWERLKQRSGVGGR